MQFEPFQIPSVIFCSTQRSGSTMMVDDFSILTGRVKFQTHENFCEMIQGGIFEQAEWSTIKNKLCERINQERKGLFIENIMYSHAEIVSKKLPISDDDVLTPFYQFFRNAVWVQVRRIDTFEQSVSKYFSAKTNVWDKRYVGDENYNLEVAYNFDDIIYYGKRIHRDKKKWNNFFKAHNIDPIVIYYEDAKDTYPEYLRPVFEKSNIKYPENISKRRMKKLGNKRNNLFKEKIFEDLFNNRFQEFIECQTHLRKCERELSQILNSRSYRLANRLSSFYHKFKRT